MQQEVLVPVSVGELIDRMTILRIKSRKITDPAKLANVAAELNALEAVGKQSGIDVAQPMVAELEGINAELWEIEDLIRDEERAKRFGVVFVELARKVYLTNDRRFAVKAKINASTGSKYREEKSYSDYGGAVKFLVAMGLSCGAALAGTARAADSVDRWLTHRSADPAQTLPAKNIGNDVMYQVFVDRFANGNPANDCPDDQRLCDPAKRDFYKFWGGDLRGVINELPYLKDLGVTKLWLTPIFENHNVTIERDRFQSHIEMTAYHGYWMKDWFRLAPNFTDQGPKDYDIVRELVAKAQPEIGVLLDTVCNHTSPSDATAWSTDRLPQKEVAPLYRDGTFVTSLADTQAFHQYGFITDYNDTFQVENYQLDGLADLNQKDPRVASYLRDAHDFWMKEVPGLAGYRMDTIKHVEPGYWRTFDRDFFGAHPDAAIVGEYYGGGPGHAGAGDFYRSTRMTMFDFEFRDAVQSVFLHNGSMAQFVQLWENDSRLIDARSLVTFIDNHDLPRMRGQGMPLAKMKQALSLMFAARGVPCIYYGLEQDLFTPNDPGDPFNRPMMTSFDRTAELFKLTHDLAQLRKAHPALRYGQTHLVHLSEKILAFERVDGNDRVFFAASTNPISGSDRFDMTGLTLPDGTYRDVLTGKEYTVRGGRLPVELRNGDVILLARSVEAA